MGLVRRISNRAAVPVLVTFCLLLAASRGPAQQPPKVANQATIEEAIDNGVRYLRSIQTPNGGWGAGTGPGSGKGWGIGYTALAGIALYECGVPKEDPALQKAAYAVRFYADEVDTTYEVALSILLLDRMGEKSDKVRIQKLAARLMAAQTPSGGWSYSVPKITGPEQVSLFAALKRMSPPPPPPVPSVRERPFTMGLCIKTSDEVVSKPPPPAFDTEKARTAALATLTPTMKRWAVFLPPNQVVLADPKDAGSDNSNTHFATLAVWAARKHDVPVERSLVLIAQRFRNSQGKDGTWGYTYARNGGGGSPALTCVALLGLAIGHVVDPDVAVRPEQDPRVVNAFAWLSGQVGAPAGNLTGRKTPKEVGGLYYMWAMERVAVLYDVGRLDKKDWYLWGAEILLAHQMPEGGWKDGGAHVEHEALSTSLALLFLRRANLTPDLSRRLTVDTGALTTKVSDTVTPKPPDPKPPEPTPKQPDPTPPKVEPPPTPTPKQPSPQPQPTPPAPTPPTEATTTTPAPEKSSSTIWIILIVVLLLVLVACVFLYLRSKNAAAEADEEEERPKKKKRKPKAELEE